MRRGGTIDGLSFPLSRRERGTGCVARTGNPPPFFNHAGLAQAPVGGGREPPPAHPPRRPGPRLVGGFPSHPPQQPPANGPVVTRGSPRDSGATPAGPHHSRR